MRPLVALVAFFSLVPISSFAQELPGIGFLETPGRATGLIFRQFRETSENLFEKATLEVGVGGILEVHTADMTFLVEVGCFEDDHFYVSHHTQVSNQLDVDTLTYTCGNKQWNFEFRRPTGILPLPTLEFLSMRWLDQLPQIPQFEILVGKNNVRIQRFQSEGQDRLEIEQVLGLQFGTIAISERQTPRFRELRSRVDLGGYPSADLLLTEQHLSPGISQRHYRNELRSADIDLVHFREHYFSDVRVFLELIVGGSLF